jgi:hypothetical protein
MSTELYSVKVKRVKGDLLELRLTLGSQAMPLSTSKTLALMLVHETWSGYSPKGTNYSGKTPPPGSLPALVSTKDICTEKLVRELAPKFIASVEVKDVLHDADGDFESTFSEEEPPEGTLVIKVTSPELLAHVKTGRVFDSVAYDA